MDLTSCTITTIPLLTQMGGKRLHPRAHRDDQQLYIDVTPAPAVPRERALLDEPLSFNSGQSPAGNWQLVAGSCAHATPFGSQCGLGNDLGAGVPGSSFLTAAGKVFKIVLALLMGYGKTRETNLTKEKIMGFDLHSTGNHKSEKGEYFRNNVWGWRRLADFVCTQTGVVQDEHKKYWQSNEGHEVTDQEALQIAKQLKALIKDGTVSKAINEVEEETKKAEENNKFVDECHRMLRDKVERETGKKNLAPADYPEKDHDTWAWIQSKYDYASSYPFTMENVEEFIEFCEQSNGFRIC